MGGGGGGRWDKKVNIPLPGTHGIMGGKSPKGHNADWKITI